MPLNLVKLCVGAATIEDLEAWQRTWRRKHKASGKPCAYHTTFQMPKRQSELLDGGSLFWVIKGVIQVRQKLVGFDDGKKADGSPCCVLLLDCALVPVRPVPRRAFQGWRYLSADDAPADLGNSAGRGVKALPHKMRRDLAELGLI